MYWDVLSMIQLTKKIGGGMRLMCNPRKEAEILGYVMTHACPLYQGKWLVPPLVSGSRLLDPGTGRRNILQRYTCPILPINSCFAWSWGRTQKQVPSRTCQVPMGPSPKSVRYGAETWYKMPVPGNIKFRVLVFISYCITSGLLPAKNGKKIAMWAVLGPMGGSASSGK